MLCRTLVVNLNRVAFRGLYRTCRACKVYRVCRVYMVDMADRVHQDSRAYHVKVSGFIGLKGFMPRICRVYSVKDVGHIVVFLLVSGFGQGPSNTR